MRNKIVLFVAAVLLGTACGTTSVSDAAVSAHARWLCNVPRFSYQEASEPADRLASILAVDGVALDEYNALVTSLDSNAAVRARVAAEYHQTCGET